MQLNRRRNEAKQAFYGCALLWVCAMAVRGHCASSELPDVPANRFCLLADNALALQARVDMIRGAQSEICLAYYAIDTGDAPMALLELLRQAACRGVNVRVLADGLKSRLPSGLEELLQREGIAIRSYHPPSEAQPLWLNRRLHDKLLLVDRSSMLIGSRNLQDEHFGMNRHNFLDCDAYLSGDVCLQASTYFEWLWATADVLPVEKTHSFGFDFADDLRLRIPLGLRVTQRRDSAYRLALNQALARSNVACRLDDPNNLWSCAEWVDEVPACLIHDLNTSKSDRNVQRQIIAMIDTASVSLWIESPYPVFSAPVQQALQRAAARGVAVHLLTSSLESTDNVLTYAAFQNRKSQLLKAGMCISEYTGADYLHGKVMVVDECLVMLGSYNFDERSDYLNLELCVRIDDPRVAQLVLQSMADRLAESELISPNGRRPAVGGAAPIGKRAAMRIGQSTTPLYRRSL